MLTRDYKNRLLTTASLLHDLRIYQLPTTPDLIWWQVHGSTIKTFAIRADRRRITKLIFRSWQPTCARLHSYVNVVCSPSYRVSLKIETHMHLIKCKQAGNRTKLQKQVAWPIWRFSWTRIIYTTKNLSRVSRGSCIRQLVPEVPIILSNVKHTYLVD